LRLKWEEQERDDPIGNDLKTLSRENGVKDMSFVSETSPTNWRLIFHCYYLSTSFVGSSIAPFFFDYSAERTESINPLEVKSEISHALYLLPFNAA
jgi:hypothetical protein